MSRNRMVPEFFHFGYFPARNKLVVSQSEKKALHIMYAALLPRFGRRALRARLPKNGVAAPAAPTIINLLYIYMYNLKCNLISISSPAARIIVKHIIIFCRNDHGDDE